MGDVSCTAFPTLKRVHVSSKDWRDGARDFYEGLRRYAARILPEKGFGGYLRERVDKVYLGKNEFALFSWW
jgi:hypothetical protein